VERKSARSRLTLPLHQVVTRVSRALLICLFSTVFVGVLPAQVEDPSEIFLKAYLSAQQGENLEHENQYKASLAKLRFAGSLIEELRRSHSDWQPAIVEYRGRKIGEAILRVQDRISRHNELNAAASPLPEIVPSLQEGEAWSEPGPEVVAPQVVDVPPERSSEVTTDGPAKKLQHKVDQLQAALEKSRNDLETARKEKEVVHTRLKEITSKLETAEKKIQTLTDSEHRAHDDLAETQASLNALQDSQRDRTAEQLRGQIADSEDEVAGARAETEQRSQALLAGNGELKLTLAIVEDNVREPNRAGFGNIWEWVEVKQRVTQLQEQLADGEKQNQYLVARIAELSVQLDQNSAQLQNTSLTGKNIEETTRLMKENELLRNIVVRERQEEARRDELRKSVLAELDKLKIKSDALNRQIGLLARPVATLSSEELDLLREPVISFSDKNRAVLNASFIFAKKSGGDSVESKPAMNNSGESKSDISDEAENVAHVSKENFAGPSEREKVMSAKPDQGSE